MARRRANTSAASSLCTGIRMAVRALGLGMGEASESSMPSGSLGLPSRTTKPTTAVQNHRARARNSGASRVRQTASRRVTPPRAMVS